MRDWKHRILKYLHQNQKEDGSYIHLNDFFIKDLGIKEDDCAQATNLREVLDKLSPPTGDQHFIDWSSDNREPYAYLGNCSTKNQNGEYMGTLKHNAVKAKITIPGSNYIEGKLRNIRDDEFKESSHKANTSLVETNNSIKELNKLLFITNILGVVIAALTGLFIALQFFKDDAINLQPISTQLEQIEKRLDTMQKSQEGINTSLEKAVKDSFYQKHH
jgi:hypothetical protein